MDIGEEKKEIEFVPLEEPTVVPVEEPVPSEPSTPDRELEPA